MPASAFNARASSAGVALLCGGWAAAIAVTPSAAGKAILAAPLVLLPLIWWTIQAPARWMCLFFPAALLLPPLPIPIGDSGPHICMLFAALGLFCGLLWLRGREISPRPLDVAFAAFFLILLASVAFAALYSGLNAAAGSLARVALFGISVYTFYYAAHGPEIEGTSRGIRYLYWIAIAAAAFACFDFYFQLPAPAGFGPQFVWLDSGVYRRAQGFFYEASTLGNFCVFFLVMIAVALSGRRADAPVSRKALAAGFIVLFSALIFSFSRGSLINLAVALLVLLWLNRKRIRVGKIAVLGAAGLAMASFIAWKFLPQFAELYWTRLSVSAEYIFSATNGVLSGRLESWNTIAAWLLAHPWQAAFGTGYKTLPYTDYLGSSLIADNMYLSLLVETGIAGLTAVIALNFCILRASLRATRSANAHKAFLATWILCFWAGQSVQMFSGDLLTYWRVLPVYFFILALALRPENATAGTPRPATPPRA
jgi:O-antigen ligase